MPIFFSLFLLQIILDKIFGIGITEFILTHGIATFIYAGFMYFFCISLSCRLIEKFFPHLFYMYRFCSLKEDTVRIIESNWKFEGNNSIVNHLKNIAFIIRKEVLQKIIDKIMKSFNYLHGLLSALICHGLYNISKKDYRQLTRSFGGIASEVSVLSTLIVSLTRSETCTPSPAVNGSTLT